MTVCRLIFGLAVFAVGCSSNPPGVASPEQVSAMDAGMTRGDVRRLCHDDGTLLMRSGFGTDAIEVRSLSVRNTFRSYSLVFRNERLLAISREDSNGSAMSQWWQKALPFPAERDAEANAATLFVNAAVPLHGDFSSVDQQEKSSFEGDDTNFMIIALTWWNPIAWVATPIILTVFAIEAANEQAFYERVDAVRLGISQPAVIAALGEPHFKIPRPGNVVYFIYDQHHVLATIGFRDGVARAVYPNCDVRSSKPGFVGN